jgi:hypothetical protein
MVVVGVGHARVDPGSKVVIEQKAQREGKAEKWKARSTSSLAYRVYHPSGCVTPRPSLDSPAIPLVPIWLNVRGATVEEEAGCCVTRVGRVASVVAGAETGVVRIVQRMRRGLLLKSTYDAGSDFIGDDSLIVFADNASDNVNSKILIASMRNDVQVSGMRYIQQY